MLELTKEDKLVLDFLAKNGKSYIETIKKELGLGELERRIGELEDAGYVAVIPNELAKAKKINVSKNDSTRYLLSDIELTGKYKPIA
jgi:hypothetical protein